MKFNRLFAVVALGVIAVAAYAVYAPDVADRWAPPVAGMAQMLHQRLFAKSNPTAPSSPDVAAGAASPIAVSAASVKRADFPIILDSLGQVQAYNNVVVRARVDGEITKIAFKEGQMVRAGDLLARIDPRPFQATLDQATAKQEQDEANLTNAKLDLARYATLAKQSFATQQQLDTQSALVRQLTASIAADAASIDAAKVQLDYATIRAPIAGRVGFRLIDEGNLVNAGQQTGIVTIAQLQPISVVFTEPQEYVDRINSELARGPLEVVVKDAEGKRLAVGKLTVSDNQVDVATGTIRLKAEFANADNALWPGLAVTTDLTLGVDRDVLTVPENAIQHGQNGLFVYVVDEESHAVVRPVKVARQDATTAVISEGLSGGEKVVTTGQLLLQPGALVAIDPGPGS